MLVEILRWHLRRLRDNNSFYLNASEWLASPGSTKFSKPMEEMSKEKRDVFLKRFCTWRGRKMSRQFTKVHSTMKSI